MPPRTALKRLAISARQGLERFVSDRSGGVVVIGAVALPVMIGSAALATEYGRALAVQTEHQRVADLASYAGAIAYGQAKSEDTMRAAVFNIATLHGVPTGEVTATLVDSPRTSGAKAVRVAILSPRPVFLAKVLGAGDLRIASNAVAEVGGGSSEGAGCIIALDAKGTGITMSGGTALNAPKCTVASNASITAPCGTKIVAKSVTYDFATAPDQPVWCKTILTKDNVPATIAKAPTTDPLAANPTVLSVTGRFPAIRQGKAPTEPGGVTGSDLDFNPWDTAKRASLVAALAGQGCSAVYGSIWTVTCTGKSFSFGNFKIDSSVSVDFNLDGPADAVYRFKSIKSESGGNYRFGRGTFVVPGGISMGGNVASFGAGTFKVGTSSVCNYSLCGNNNGAMTFAGPSNFELAAGIYVSGGNVVKLGSGEKNRYEIGSGPSGKAIYVQSGSAILADSKTAYSESVPNGSGAASVLSWSPLFNVWGRVETGGGTCLVLPASAQHDMVGSIDVAGALALGAGIYTIDGFLALGQNYGGAVDCNGRAQTSLYAVDVTIVLSGKETATSWACSGAAFCAASGYKDMVLTSPATGDFAQLAVIGPTSKKAGATLTSGASGGRITGAFYFPTGPISLGGGASASGSQDSCLFLLGTSITVSGGTAAASECDKITGGSSGSAKVAKLVQ